MKDSVKALAFFLIMISPILLGLVYVYTHPTSQTIVRGTTGLPGIGEHYEMSLTEATAYPYIIVAEILMIFTFVPLVMLQKGENKE